MTLVELCAGTASVSLWALGRCAPLCGFMGSKRRWASMLVEALGVAATVPDRVVLVDAGPWGDTWLQLKDATVRRAVAGLLLAWDDRRLEDLWRDCVSAPPSSDPAQRVAQFLFLQARSAGSIPVWWNAELRRWRSPTGSRETDLELRHKGGSKREGPPCEAGNPKRRGLQRAGTLARRVAALEALPWDRVEVLHQDVRHVEPIPGAVVYIDPPYLGAPRYAALLPRFGLLDLAVRWADAGARVAVSEAEPLPLPGWTHRRLPSRKPEWVTASWPLTLPEQLQLWEAA